MKLFAVILTALVGSAPMARAQDAPLDIHRVAQIAQSANGFAPRGWETEAIARGDLNKDGRADAVIVLVEDKPANGKSDDFINRPRALVIALNTKSGWQRVGFSNQLLMGTGDGGAFYGVSPAPVQVAIEKGVVLVNMEFGSREVTATTHRLRWEPKRRAVYVIGLDSITHDRLDGSAIIVSANYLTGVKTTKTLPPGNDKYSVVTEKIARNRRWLGAVTEDDRYTP